MLGDGPGNGGGDQLQVGDQAGGQVDGADLRAVAELERGGDQADDQRGGQFIDAVQFRIADVADEKTEVERCRQQDEKTENDFSRFMEPLPKTNKAPRR
jgi:hypothetical protein